MRISTLVALTCGCAWRIKDDATGVAPTGAIIDSFLFISSPQIEDAGGVDALSNGAGNRSARIEVSEKVLALERLNPTPRPTT